jgi:23S rRNA (guanine745-N1)-methyltransferase
MHPDALAALRCPQCGAPFSQDGRTLRCGAGHAFDLARSGYVSFLVGRGAEVEGDDASMVAARARFLEAGHFAPLSAALAALGRGAAPGLAVELGAGTAHHLARVLDALPSHAGLAVDVSAAAARRAARAHPRASAIVADARRALPLADACAALALVAFAPRNGGELRRILRAGGLLVVATPTPAHLAELRPAFHLLEVDPEKPRRLEEALAPGFDRVESRSVRWEMRLGPADCEALVAMGPSARHLAPAEIAVRARGLPDPLAVTGDCTVDVWRPR